MKILIGVVLCLALELGAICLSREFYITVDEDEVSAQFNGSILELRAKLPLPISKPTTKYHN
jgi:hypothetical protein